MRRSKSRLFIPPLVYFRRRVLKPTVYVSALTPQALRDDVYRDRNANNGRVKTPGARSGCVYENHMDYC